MLGESGPRAVNPKDMQLLLNLFPKNARQVQTAEVQAEVWDLAHGAGLKKRKWPRKWPHLSDFSAFVACIPASP